MTKADLIAKIAHQANLSKSASGKALNHETVQRLKDHAAAEVLLGNIFGAEE